MNVSASRATTTVIAGLMRFSSAASPIPMVLPSPAAPTTTATMISGLRLLSGRTSGSRSRNAMNISRNPDSQRGPQLARSANATAAGIRPRGWPRFRTVSPNGPAQDHPGLALGRVDRVGQPDRADRRDHEQDEPEAQRPLRAQPREQRRDRRARWWRRRSPRGTPGRWPSPGSGLAGADAVRRRRESRRTPWTTPAPRAPRRTPTASRRMTHAPAPSTGTPGTPSWRRSPSGGRARTGRGTARSAAPRSRTAASSGRGTARPGRGPRPTGTVKNSEPASEMATAVSPAVLNTCIWISRESPDSPAPCASDARLALSHGEAAGAAGAAGHPRAPRAGRPRGRAHPAAVRLRRARPGSGSRQRCSSAMRHPAGHAPILPAAWVDLAAQSVMLQPVTTTVSAKLDSAAAAAVDAAQAALLEDVAAGRRGRPPRRGRRGRARGQPPVRVHPAGYVGWRWSVTVARAPRQKTVTVDEIVLLPGRGGDRRPRVAALPRADPAR